jgi:enoyl-CoA hydratase/carnithine racemase
MTPYFRNLSSVLAKITSKNQLTLPKSVTQALGPVQYFEVQEKAGQIILTPVRIQRGDAVRAKLAELAIDDKALDAALEWAQRAASKPLSAKKVPTKKPATKTLAAKKTPVKPLSARKTTSAVVTPTTATRKRTR